MQSTFYPARRTPHGASCLVQAMPACSWKPDVLRPGMVGMRGSVVIRPRAMHKLSTPSVPQPRSTVELRMPISLRTTQCVEQTCTNPLICTWYYLGNANHHICLTCAYFQSSHGSSFVLRDLSMDCGLTDADISQIKRCMDHIGRSGISAV